MEPVGFSLNPDADKPHFRESKHPIYPKQCFSKSLSKQVNPLIQVAQESMVTEPGTKEQTDRNSSCLSQFIDFFFFRPCQLFIDRMSSVDTMFLCHYMFGHKTKERTKRGTLEGVVQGTYPRKIVKFLTFQPLLSFLITKIFFDYFIFNYQVFYKLPSTLGRLG